MKRETDRQVLSFFQNLLELKAPWRVVAVELKEAERSVEIAVEWPDSYKVPCASNPMGSGLHFLNFKIYVRVA